MGGPGSSRWHGVQTRPLTKDFCAIDVRFLAKIGVFSTETREGDAFKVTWQRGKIESDSALIEWTGSSDHLAEAIRIVYRQHDATAAVEEIRETVTIERTSVHLGGECRWFQCPGCSRRCAILRNAGGLFRCTRCHGLAYASTRDDAGVRSVHRCTKLFDRLQAPDGMAWEVPAKPPGMHRTTYEPIALEIERRLASSGLK